MIQNPIKKRIEQLKRPLKDKVEEYREEAPYPFPDEVGLKHPNNNVGVHLRDDNTLELYAGNTRIILDGNTGTISFSGTHLVSDTADTNINILGEKKLAINFHPFNTDWLPKNIGEIQQKSPAIIIDKNFKVLAGMPATEAQYPVALGDLFRSMPLFLDPISCDFLKSLKAILSE